MIIDLGLEEQTHQVVCDIDPIEASAELHAAVESLQMHTLQMDALDAAIEATDHSIKLAQAVADKTGDNGVALAVGKESMTIALAPIGQAVLADSIMAGVESLDVGAEGAGELLKKMVTKAKEMANKVWKFIRELLVKVINFVKGLFGKKEDTYETLKALLDKAKADGRIKLTTTKFDQAVRERLSKEVTTLLASGKTIDDTRIVEAIRIMEKLIPEKKASEKLKGDIEAGAKILIDAGNNAKEGEDIDPNLVEDAFNIVFNNSITKLLTSSGIHYSEIVKGVEDHVSKVVEEQLSDVDSAIVELTAVTPSKVKLFAITATEDAKEAFKKFDEGEGDTKNNISKISSGLNVKVITVEFKYEDVKDNVENVVPIDYTGASKVVEAFKSANKGIDSKLSKFEKVVADAEKKAKKVQDALIKGAIKNENKLASLYADILSKLVDVSSKIELAVYKAMAEGAAMAASELARSKFSHIIKESVRLYEK